MEGNKFKALAEEIMEDHAWWSVEEETGFHICAKEGCGATISEKQIPTPEERRSHQIDKLLEAGFTMIEPEKDRFGTDEGQTIESPGMVRWYNESHYFLKRIGNMWDGIRKPNTFVLGLENRYGDGAYIFSNSIEFDNDEAPDLMDRIAAFNDLPTYTELMKSVAAINALVKDMERTDRIEDRYLMNRLRAILEG